MSVFVFIVPHRPSCTAERTPNELTVQGHPRPTLSYAHLADDLPTMPTAQSSMIRSERLLVRSLDMDSALSGHWESLASKPLEAKLTKFRPFALIACCCLLSLDA
jgi:hypothetical protein